LDWAFRACRATSTLNVPPAPALSPGTGESTVAWIGGAVSFGGW
jgi:hypothetical protein